MILEKITDLIAKIPDTLKGDIGIYLGAAITVLTFVVALVIGLVGKGELSKFVSLARKAAKDGSASGVNACMQKMPVKVKKQYKRAMVSGVKPSDVVSIDAAVNTPYMRSAVAKMPIITAVGTAVGMCVGAGLAVLVSGSVDAGVGAAVAISAIVGGILMIVAAAIASVSYKGAVKAYDALVELLDSARSGGAQQAMHEEPVVEQQSYSQDANEQPVYEQQHVYEQQPVYEQQAAYEQQPVYEQTQQEYESPVYEQTATQYEEPVVRPEPEPTQDDEAEKAEREAREKQAAAEKAAAAQKRLEELRAQREAQLKARRQAQAQANAGAQAASGARPTVTAEDVIARIDKIESEGASLAAMKEVAMLLQKERVKPENKTPEQQKKLNEALAKLLKAMSAAQKKA